VRVSEPLIAADFGGDEDASDWDRAIGLRAAARAEMLRHCGEPDLANRRELSWSRAFLPSILPNARCDLFHWGNRLNDYA
jgi:hypothetical protein